MGGGERGCVIFLLGLFGGSRRGRDENKQLKETKKQMTFDIETLLTHRQVRPSLLSNCKETVNFSEVGFALRRFAELFFEDEIKWSHVSSIKFLFLLLFLFISSPPPGPGAICHEAVAAECSGTIWCLSLHLCLSPPHLSLPFSHGRH